MVQFNAEIKGNLELQKAKNHPTLTRVIHIGRAAQIRREIGMLADNDFAKGLINQEAYKGYREVAEGREEYALNDQMLESTRKFALEHEAAAIQIYAKIEAAGVDDEEKEYLMDNWVRGNFELGKKPHEAKKIVEGKLERLVLYKKKQDELYAHPLIKDADELQIDASKTIKILSPEALEKKRRKEQRAYLDELEAALPKAEKYAETQEKKEFSKMDLEYQGMLFEKRRQKIIGRNTFHKYFNAFVALKDKKEKQRWIDEFGHEMERYELLQEQIHNTLKGAALKRLQSKLDEFGYTQMLAAFGKEKEAENNRLNERFTEALEYYRTHGIEENGIQKGIIGDHTIEENKQWIKSENLNIQDKYDIISKVPDEMQRYQNLWNNIIKLPKEQRDEIRANIDKWGYKEMKAEYERYKRGEAIPTNQSGNEAVNILNQVRNSRAKKAIVETGEMLAEKGKNTTRSFAGVLKRIFGGQNREQFDAVKFEDQVRERVIENKNMILKEAEAENLASEEEMQAANEEREARKKVQHIKAANDPLYDFEVDEDDDDVEDEIDVLDASDESEVTEQYGVTQVETWDEEEGKVHREAEFAINTNNGIDRLLAEDKQHHYQSEASGGRDDVSLAFLVGEEKVEMDHDSIMKATRYFEKAANEEEYEKKKDEAA